MTTNRAVTGSNGGRDRTHEVLGMRARLPNFSVNGNNQLTNTGFAYDAAGDMTNDGVNGYVYDAEGRQSSAAGVSYTYDGNGRRVEKGSGTLYWHGVGGDVLSETDLNGNNGTDYVYFGGHRLARVTSTGVYYYFQDHLDSARINVQAGQNTSCYEADFDPYGGEHVITNTCTHHYKFTGKERDSGTGHDYFGARYNASSLGRFMTPDPLLNSGRPGNPQTWNRYAYARNNPLSIIDPTGLYDLVNTCASDDTKCNKQFQQHANDLKKGLESFQKQADKVKDPVQKARVQAALKAFGTQGDNNGVNVSFGPTRAGGAGETDPVYNGEGAKETYNVTLDPNQISSRNDYAIDAAHEGTHLDDLNTMLANPSGTVLSPFSYEYRGYETSAWAAQALGEPNLSFAGNMIWNESWKAADRQTLMDRGITNVVEGPPYSFTATVPHNPWPN